MKALSIHQPWAWAIAAGIKTIEIRQWYNPYRGVVLLHATRLYDDNANFSVDIIKARTFQAIIGYAYLVDIKKYETPEAFNAEYSYHFNQPVLDVVFDNGGCLYGWVFKHPYEFPEPITDVRGFQKLWTPSKLIADRAREMKLKTDEF